MFVNYFITALRHFKKNRVFSIINITGLSIGIAVSIIGFLFVVHELSYDRFHEKSDRIVRITVDALVGNTEIRQLYTPAPMARALYDEFPEVEKVCRITNTQNARVFVDERVYREKDILLVDSGFFNMFSFQLLSGDRNTVLSQPYSVVLSRKIADKYFGDLDPIGEVINYKHFSEDAEHHLKVTGIMEDFPENSHFHADLLVSVTSFDGVYNNPAWFDNFFRTYILLKDEVNYKDLDAKMPYFADKYLFEGRYEERTSGTSNKWELHLQPLHNIHLNSDYRGEFKSNGKKEYVYIFLIVSIFILLVACVNFVNLSTAKSATRSLEVGIRKVLGSGKAKLFIQFLGESLLYSMISLVAGLLLVELLLGLISELFDIHMVMPYLSSVFTIPVLIMGGLLLGILSGIYPAMVLSRFSPLYAMKNYSFKGNKSPWLRNVLVVFQFTVSVILIFGTIIIFRQMELLQNEDLGFDKENIIVINNTSSLGQNLHSFKQEILQQPYVLSASVSHRLPGIPFNNLGFRADEFDEGFSLNLCACDEEFIDVLNFEMIEGRFFSDKYGTDSASAILNEEAWKLLGWRNPIGKRIRDNSSNRNYYTVVGVVKNLYYESKHHSIQPMAFLHIDNAMGLPATYISVKVIDGEKESMITGLNHIWDSFTPEVSFEYSIFEENYDLLYKNEQQTMSLFIAFSFLAVFIACLGLLGLSSFILEQRTREIGIRKVFGASAANISLMFTGKFIRWVIIANIIGWPLAWYVMDNWLQNFQYRVSLAWWVFLAASVITIIVAVITTLYESLKAAYSNPINVLRHN